MTALRKTVIEDTLDEVRIVYLDRETSKWWNARRDKDDTATFCGHYWIKGLEEAGPFKTRSSAIRDAYYRFVLKREQPLISNSLTPRGRKSYKAAAHGRSEARAA